MKVTYVKLIYSNSGCKINEREAITTLLSLPSLYKNDQFSIGLIAQLLSTAQVSQRSFMTSCPVQT